MIRDVGEIFKQHSLREARKQLKHVLTRWEPIEGEACRLLTTAVDRLLVFYQVVTGPWRTHLKATNIPERFFRELKRFEKSRQFRFADEITIVKAPFLSTTGTNLPIQDISDRPEFVGLRD